MCQAVSGREVPISAAGPHVSRVCYACPLGFLFLAGVCRSSEAACRAHRTSDAAQEEPSAEDWRYAVAQGAVATVSRCRATSLGELSYPYVIPPPPPPPFLLHLSLLFRSPILSLSPSLSPDTDRHMKISSFLQCVMPWPESLCNFSGFSGCFPSSCRKNPICATPTVGGERLSHSSARP